jgi:hypothetical protein
MISKFKFLTDNEEEDLTVPVYDIEPNYASWMWARQENVNRDPNWLVDHMSVLNIRTFLSMFPEQMIIPILSITGNEITMTIDDVNDEWPFSLNGETPLHITFLRWVPEI